MTYRVSRLPLLAGIVTLVALVTACGESRESSTAATSDTADARSVDIAMQDIKFDRTTLTVRAGETVEFQFTNTGMVVHDAFIGDVEAQMEHDAEMAHSGDTAGHSMLDAAITLEPGDTGSLSYTFTERGTYEIGCHQPGHYQAGMKIQVVVE